MEKINKKFAWIVDGSGANSWGVKNDEAIHLKDDTYNIMKCNFEKTYLFI